MEQDFHVATTSAPPAKSRSRELNNYEPDTRSVGFQVLRTEFQRLTCK